MAEPAGAQTPGAADEPGSLALEQHFAIVPEWIIDAPISHCAYRLYSVLLRYGQTSGQRMPARATLAARMRMGSKDTIDRALKELVGIGAVVVERWRRDGRDLTSRYPLMATPPPARTAATAAGGGGRKNAATLAADLRPDPSLLPRTPISTAPTPRAGGPPAGRNLRHAGADARLVGRYRRPASVVVAATTSAVAGPTCWGVSQCRGGSRREPCLEQVVRGV